MTVDPSGDDFNPHPFEPTDVYDAGHQTCAECGHTRAWPEHSVNYRDRWPTDAPKAPRRRPCGTDWSVKS